MTTALFRSGFVLLLILSLVSEPVDAQQAPDKAAEIVGLQGTGQFRPETVQDWRAAQIKQALQAGTSLRTGDLSRMGILFIDQTQIRLNQNSTLLIKQVAATPSTTDSTVLTLLRGRAWSQSKQAPKTLKVETPSAVAAIRGTDWELAVEDNGRSTLTVLSGEVDFFNDFGSVVVARGEQATAEVGRAPVKLIISNPRDRVQWVTAYSVDPIRYTSLTGVADPARLTQQLGTLSGDSVETLVTRGEVLLDLGRWTEAAQAFDAAIAREEGNGRAQAGRGFVAVHEGQPDRAEPHFSRAAAALGDRHSLVALGRAAVLIQRERFREAIDLLDQIVAQGDLTQPAALLLLADLSIYSGDTQKAVDQADAARARFPNDDRVESTLSRIHLLADRHDESRARAQAALAANPRSVEGHVALGDLARTEGRAADARAAYLAAIAINPGDSRAWYGLGTVDAEREDVRRARPSLAEAIELDPDGPGYVGELGTLETFANRLKVARPLYDQALARRPDDYIALTGQALLELKQGRADRAIELLLRATLAEPRYARAHMYMAVAYYRQGRVDRALEELARASELDPKDPFPHMLVSLIRTDVIQPAAAIDAGRTALELMPYLKSLNQLANNQKGSANLGNGYAFFGMEEWAQHLAQGSYYPYWAGSHLFLGDRYSSPFIKNSEYFTGLIADPTVFGASNRFQTLLPKPGTYVTAGVNAGKQGGLEAVQPLVTVNGLAYLPAPTTYFLEVEDSRVGGDDVEGTIRLDNVTAALGVTPTAQLGVFGFGNYNVIDGVIAENPSEAITRQVYAGTQYKFSPTSALWVRGGWDYADTTVDFLTEGAPSTFEERNKIRDFQVRQTSTLGRHEVTFGLEIANRRQTSSLILRADEQSALIVTEQDRDRSRFAYISDRLALGSRWLIEGGLFVQRFTKRVETSVDFSTIDPTIENPPAEIETEEHTTVAPRAGVVYRFGPQRLIRGTYQRWDRPVSVGSLSPIATAGLPLDDRLVNLGGRLHRGRIQTEWAFTPRTFAMGFVDYRSIKNLALDDGLEGAPELTDLERLRSRSIANIATDDLLAGDLAFQEGALDKGELTIVGGALNQVLTSRLSLYARYFFGDTVHTGDEERAEANALPYVPRQLFAVGSTVIGPHRLYVTGQVNIRSRQFQDDLNDIELPADTTARLSAYWETKNKRFSIQTLIDHMFNDLESVSYEVELKVRY